MLCLPIPGTEVAGDPRRLGNIFDGTAEVTVLSGGPPGAEVSFGGPGDTGTWGAGPWLETGGAGDTLLWAAVRWRISDKSWIYAMFNIQYTISVIPQMTWTLSKNSVALKGIVRYLSAYNEKFIKHNTENSSPFLHLLESNCRCSYKSTCWYDFKNKLKKSLNYIPFIINLSNYNKEKVN